MAFGPNDRYWCPIETEEPDGPRVIEPEVSRVAVAVVLWIGGALFSSIAGGVLWYQFNPQNLSGLICPGIFFAIGLALDGLALFFTLKCFNPLPILALSHRNLYPGTEFEVSWMFRGKSSAISKLKIRLIGKEKVSYREGTKTRTEESIFFEKTLVETEDPPFIAQGFELVELPKNTMHSFKSSNNEILWLLQVDGVVKWWPDLDDAFPVMVLAPPAA
jgi:hypothetical protein